MEYLEDEVLELLTVIIILLVGIICWRMWIISKGILRPMGSIKMAIFQLLEMGYENGVLVITPKGTKNFIQFGKYIKNRNEYGIELSFPNAVWSNEYFHKLRKLCDAEGIKYRIVKGVDHSMEFLDIDFGKNTNDAYRISKHIAENIFGLPEDHQYHVKLDNARFPTQEERIAMQEKLKEKSEGD